MSTIQGEYFIPDLREMATGFLLKPDHTFEFFFTYGALDRYAKGTWKQEGGRVILNSADWSGADFTLVESRALAAEEGIMIQLQPANPMLAVYLQVSLEEGKPDSWIQFRQQGILHLPPGKVNSLSLLFEFCPERFTKLTVPAGHTSFTIRPEQSLFEFFLKNFELRLSPEGLEGKHPMLDGAFVYRRNSE